MSKLLLIGWDAADWKVIDPLLARGEMPHLANLLQQGVRGNIATIYPPYSPMVWTSIATGKRPAKHGILGFTEPTADGLAVQPVTNLGRRTKALWNILHQNGKRSVVVGWWPSHPAEPIRGAMVSDLFPLKGPDQPNTSMAPGTVSPPSLASSLADLRVHPNEIDGPILSLFVPGWERIDQKKDKSLHDLAGIIAETMSIHAVATELMETQAWDVAAVYYAGIDHFCHRFMRYHAGRRAGSGPTDPAMFAGVVENAYRYHDVMLGRLLALAGPDSAVILLSDHGFHSDRLLPDYIPAEAAGPAVEHRHFGIFCMRAPGVKAGERIYGASVLDVTPTALHLLGIPAATDMDGRVLLNAFQEPGTVQKIPSWDAVEGDDGSHPSGARFDGTAAAAALKQLVDLGYVAPPGKDALRAVEDSLIEQRYNLARCHADAGRPDLAVPLLRELIASDPEQGRFYSTLAACLLQQGDTEGCRNLLDEFDAAASQFAPRAAGELKKRCAEKPDSSVEELDDPEARHERFERRQLAEKATGFAQMRLVLRCRLALNQRRAPRQKAHARALLQELAKQRRQSTQSRLFLAEGLTSLKEYDQALVQLERVRRVDPDNWEALALEARIHFQFRRYEAAVNRAVESLALVYSQPWLHHLLGLALERLGERVKAEEAFVAALRQAPEYIAAHESLGRLICRDRSRIGEGSLLLARAAVLRRRFKQPEQTGTSTAPQTEASEIAAPQVRFESSRSETPMDRSQAVVVVAGLPRTGTSMMMQVLAAGGIPPYTDKKRLPDEDNPRGYLEHERATRLHQDATWLPDARGKAVKIVAQLFPYLPTGEQYRVVMMHRNLEEVIESQRAMLRRLDRKGGELADARLMRAYTQQLVQVQSWLGQHPEIPVLAIKYGEALADPAGTAARLAGFLGGPFDERAAAAAIEPSLHRQKTA